MKNKPQPELEKPESEVLIKERNKLLYQIQNMVEMPMIILGFVWLVLLIIELVWELHPMLELLNVGIWILFILDFLLQFSLAPLKLKFLKQNVLTLISLVIPAFRLFRIGRVLRIMRTVRAARGLRLVEVIGSLNRGMKSLSASMGRRGFGYVLILSLVVLFTGAAGMHAFEKTSENGLQTYGESVWWTAMVLISMGSSYWPQTMEGRVLCFLLSLYGFAVFGYFTATLASFFMDLDAGSQKAEIAGTKQLKELHAEIKELRREMTTLIKLKSGPPDKNELP